MIYTLFDIDKTLLELKEGLDEASSGIMFQKIFGLKATEDQVLTYGKTEMYIISEVLKKFGKNNTVPDVAYKTWGKELEKLLTSNKVKILPGISKLLENLLSNKNISLNLLTGNSTWRAEPKMKSVDLDRYFRDKNSGKLNGVFGELSKERVDLLKIFKSKIKLEDKIIVIDDSLEGAMMSKTEGVPVISVATGKIKQEEFAPYTNYIFPDFGEERWRKAVKIILNI